MGVEQDLAAAATYIRQTNRRIAKERALADRTANVAARVPSSRAEMGGGAGCRGAPQRSSRSAAMGWGCWSHIAHPPKLAFNLGLQSPQKTLPGAAGDATS